MKESITKELNDIKAEVEDYVNARIDLAKLNAAENLSRFFISLLTKVVMLFIVFFTILFLSMAAAIWLDNFYNNSGLGFLIVTGVYIFFLIIFLLIRKKFIARPIIKSFIQLFFPSQQNYDDIEKK